VGGVWHIDASPHRILYVDDQKIIVKSVELQNAIYQLKKLTSIQNMNV
jgi:hypothetical protein